jgi:hypothetical protein
VVNVRDNAKVSYETRVHSVLVFSCADSRAAREAVRS